MLSDAEKKNLLKRFPDVELSYENVLHKKVYADVFMIIPKGQKAFLWITYYKNKNIPFLLLLNNRGNIINIELCHMCFDNCLAYGTILYGTLFNINNNRCFSCEDIHMYKGKMINNNSLSNRLCMMTEMFKFFIVQKSLNNNFIIPGIAPCFPNKPAAEVILSSLPYKVYSIKLFDIKGKGRELGHQLIKEKFIPEAIFKVKARQQDDIYNLYCYDYTNQNIPYGIAMISTYKQSVMMNKLFRTIKENDNLDLLEESDDEEEFENINEDKYVNLNKSLIMKCVYSYKFRKWEPISVITEKTKLITRKETQILENKVL
jgi:hypothetical protein